MALFDFMKKKANVKKHQPLPTESETNSFGERYDRLTKDGELPFGWIYRNKDFTDKIQSEYSYFLNLWLESRNKSPLDQFAALKSFVLYLDDAGKMCELKGECFKFWFYECIASKDYIQERKCELDNLTTNFDESQMNYNKRNNQRG